MDAIDDPAHGQQQLTFFHGRYGANQYLPIVFTSAENDAVVLIGLRHGTCGAALGAEDDVQYLNARLKAAWPDVNIYVRGDCGFGLPRNAPGKLGTSSPFWGSATDCNVSRKFHREADQSSDENRLIERGRATHRNQS